MPSRIKYKGLSDFMSTIYKKNSKRDLTRVKVEVPDQFINTLIGQLHVENIIYIKNKNWLTIFLNNNQIHKLLYICKHFSLNN